MSIRAQMEELMEGGVYRSPKVAVEKFHKALVKGDTPHEDLAKMLYDTLMALHDSMTSKGGLKGKLGHPLKKAAGELLKLSK